jgi:hypothetical protein
LRRLISSAARQDKQRRKYWQFLVRHGAILL